MFTVSQETLKTCLKNTGRSNCFGLDFVIQLLKVTARKTLPTCKLVIRSKVYLPLSNAHSHKSTLHNVVTLSKYKIDKCSKITNWAKLTNSSTTVRYSSIAFQWSHFRNLSITPKVRNVCQVVSP